MDRRGQRKREVFWLGSVIGPAGKTLAQNIGRACVHDIHSTGDLPREGYNQSYEEDTNQTYWLIRSNHSGPVALGWS